MSRTAVCSNLWPARVYPLHLFMVVVVLLATPSVDMSWRALPANLTLTQAWFPDVYVVFSFAGVAWSLSCEAFFYALFPFVNQWAAKMRRPLRVASAVVALVLACG